MRLPLELLEEVVHCVARDVEIIPVDRVLSEGRVSPVSIAVKRQSDLAVLALVCRRFATLASSYLYSGSVFITSLHPQAPSLEHDHPWHSKLKSMAHVFIRCTKFGCAAPFYYLVPSSFVCTELPNALAEMKCTYPVPFLYLICRSGPFAKPSLCWWDEGFRLVHDDLCTNDNQLSPIKKLHILDFNWIDYMALDEFFSFGRHCLRQIQFDTFLDNDSTFNVVFASKRCSSLTHLTLTNSYCEEYDLFMEWPANLEKLVLKGYVGPEPWLNLAIGVEDGYARPIDCLEYHESEEVLQLVKKTYQKTLDENWYYDSPSNYDSDPDGWEAYYSNCVDDMWTGEMEMSHELIQRAKEACEARGAAILLNLRPIGAVVQLKDEE